MTPWEIAYHFSGKYKEYVMREFPDGQMPAASQTTQEGASPPTLTHKIKCMQCCKVEPRVFRMDMPFDDQETWELIDGIYYCNECAVISRLAIALF